jgi:predicted DsbA family dithiol-disulfide isomerase
MHDLMFANQRALGPTDLTAHARALGLDGKTFGDCLQGGTHAARVRRDLADGQKAGVRGTPTFFLGVVDAGGKVRVVQVLRGAQPAAAFKAAIDAALGAQK